MSCPANRSCPSTASSCSRDRLAAALAEQGVQPVRQVSIDGTWSALRFRPANG